MAIEPTPPKKLQLPTELLELKDELFAARNLKKDYIKRPFGFKKAMRAQTLSQKLEREFWAKVVELYPETGNAPWTTNEKDNYIYLET